MVKFKMINSSFYTKLTAGRLPGRMIIVILPGTSLYPIFKKNVEAAQTRKTNYNTTR